MRPATRCGASLLLDRNNRGSSVDSGAWLPVALPGAASTAIVHLRLRMNELRKLSGGTITSFDERAGQKGRYLPRSVARLPRARNSLSQDHPRESAIIVGEGLTHGIALIIMPTSGERKELGLEISEPWRALGKKD
jgi:hypothetical protein